MPLIANRRMQQSKVGVGMGWVAGCLMFILSGCASDGGSRSAGSTTAVKARTPAKDRVLWAYRNGLTALRQGRNEEAKIQLDEALSIIGNVFGPDKSAKR